MSSSLERLERALRKLPNLVHSVDSLELSILLLKATLEVAVFAALLYLVGEIVNGLWSLAHNITGVLL
ncbi:MAG: hypothetical protein QXY39_08850, partial [Thermofilaceae archaeon]